MTIVAGKASKDRASCVAAGGSTSGTTCLGITSQEFVTYKFPIDVKIDTQLVGGPSAGLAFTLAIIDDLTPGALTGGKRVAVTGTIAPDGSVGAVGGVEQKAITARHERRAADDRAEIGGADARARCGQRPRGGRRQRRPGARRTAAGGRKRSAATVDDRGAIMSA